MLGLGLLSPHAEPVEAPACPPSPSAAFAGNAEGGVGAAWSPPVECELNPRNPSTGFPKFAKPNAELIHKPCPAFA